MKKGTQKRVRPISKPKKTKGTCERKMNVKESESNLLIDIVENELYDDDDDDAFH